MRKQIVAGNWKMNKTVADAEKLLSDLDSFVKNNAPKCDVIVAIPSIYLQSAKKAHTNFTIACQDISKFASGAYTGEISAEMLKSIGVDTTLVGHSERRQYHGESNTTVASKIQSALDQGVTPIFCNGEMLEDRKAENHLNVVREQTEIALFNLTAEQIKKVIVAYEPVWAIGTGETATAEQAQEMHAYIRSLIADKYGKEVADEISILYGGSVNPSNAKEIFSQADVDGGLVGGASLKMEDFGALIDTYKAL